VYINNENKEAVCSGLGIGMGSSNGHKVEDMLFDSQCTAYLWIDRNVKSRHDERNDDGGSK
jgi:hypothetical protein